MDESSVIESRFAFKKSFARMFSFLFAEPRLKARDEKVVFADEEEDLGPPTWNSLLCSSPASVIFGDELILWGGWDGAGERKKTEHSVGSKGVTFRASCGHVGRQSQHFGME